MLDSLGSLLAVVAVAALTPILVAAMPGRVPQVVLLILGGILIGPETFNIADGRDIELFANLGLGFLFLMVVAGNETTTKLGVVTSGGQTAEKDAPGRESTLTSVAVQYKILNNKPTATLKVWGYD